MTPTPALTPTARRLAGGLALAAVLGLGVAVPAGANEFPPKPAAVAAAKCQPEGGFAYSLTNIGGHVAADFAITVTTVDGTTTTDATVDVDATVTGFAPVPEDTDATITITSQYMADVSLTEHVDCLDSPTATITSECLDDGESFEFRLVDPDHTVQVGWEVHLAGEVDTYAPGATFAKYYGLGEGEAWDARVLADGVEVASLDGTTDCVDPSALIELECTDDGPVLHVALGRDDVTATWYQVSWPGDDPTSLDASVERVDGGDEGPLVLSRELPRETEFSVTVTSDPDGVVASLAGSTDCAEVEVEETPVTTPTPEAPWTPVTPVEVPVVTSTGGVAPVGEWSPATATGRTELARTGAETPLLLGAGSTLLALGEALRRLGRRLVTS